MTQMRLWRHWSGVFDRFVTASEFTGSVIESAGLPKATIIPNGVPLNAARPALSEPPTAFFSGRLVKEKGVRVLLQAWETVVQQIPAARLIIAGDGPDRPIYEKMAGRGVTFVGHVPYSGVEEVARPAWVTVVPSMWLESFGLVAAESSMRGTAVIASRIGGLPEIVQDGENGLLVEPNRPDQLAQALVRLLGDREGCEAMGRRGREIALRKFSVEVQLDRFIETYEEMRRPAKPALQKHEGPGTNPRPREKN